MSQQNDALSKTLKVSVIATIAALISGVTSLVAMYLAINKPPVTIAITDSGRVIPVIPLNKPYVTDSRVLAFSEECSRRAFSHDFLNFRITLGDASKCFTSDGAKLYAGAMDPLVQELVSKRMIMTPTVQPPVVVRGPFDDRGRVTWVVQTKMQLFREGQKERVTPQNYILEMAVVRVELEENIRGIAINNFIVRPA